MDARSWLTWGRLTGLLWTALGLGWGIFTIHAMAQGASYVHPVDLWAALTLAIVVAAVVESDGPRLRLAPEKQALILAVLVAIAAKETRWDWRTLPTVWLPTWASAHCMCGAWPTSGNGSGIAGTARPYEDAAH